MVEFVSAANPHSAARSLGHKVPLCFAQILTFLCVGGGLRQVLTADLATRCAELERVEYLSQRSDLLGSVATTDAAPGIFTTLSARGVRGER